MGKDNHKRKGGFLFWNKVARWFQEHWIWHSLFTIVPSIVFFIVPLYWSKTENSPWRHIAQGFIVFALGSLFFTVFVSNKFSFDYEREQIANLKKIRDDLRNELHLRSALLQLYTDICEEKYISVFKKAKALSSSKINGVSQVLHNPSEQISKILDCTKKTICNTQNIDEAEMVICLAYRIPSISDSMRWVNARKPARGITLNRLVNDHNTTFHKALEEKRNIFYNSKLEAYQNHCYVCDSRESDHPDGSIFCDYIDISDDEHGQDTILIEAVLSIDTKNRPFVMKKEGASQARFDKTVENFKNNLVKVILADVYERLKIELTYLYLADTIKYKNKNEKKK